MNATGSWSPVLTPGLEVKKRKGHLVITDRYPNFLRHQLVELGYSEERALANRRLSCFQHPTAQDRTVVDRIFETVSTSMTPALTRRS